MAVPRNNAHLSRTRNAEEPRSTNGTAGANGAGRDRNAAGERNARDTRDTRGVTSSSRNSRSSNGNRNPNSSRNARSNPSSSRSNRNARPTRGAGNSMRSNMFGSCTNIGLVRPQNEDSLVAAPPLFAVADGMGGHAAGEIASEIAVRVLADRAPQHPDAISLGKVVEAANHAIIRAAHEGRGRDGMGTTCTAALLEGERLVVAQVGDSRAYLLHQGSLQQITRDHSLMADMIDSGEITPEEARSHPKRSVITRALGSDPRTEPDLYEINVASGDRLLLCTDGLSGMVRDSEIARILLSAADPQRCAQSLVDAALAAGGNDNVTVIVVDVAGLEEVRQKRAARKTTVTVAIIALLFALVLGAGAFAFNALVNESAYLAELDGKVAVYQGFPGELFGKELSELAYTTTIEVNDLPPGAANRLRTEGISADNMKAALSLVEAYAMDLGTTFDAVATAVSSEPASTGGEPA